MVANWTVEAVKSELPDVRILIFGKIATGFVRGRLDQFATVVYGDANQHSAAFAWKTIANALNSGRPLRV